MLARAVLLTALAAACGPATRAGEVGLALLDTRASSSAPLAAERLAKWSGWQRIPHGQGGRPFKGDAVLANRRLAAAVRRRAGRAELYAKAAGGWRLRASLVLLAEGQPAELSSIRAVANDANAVSVDALYTTPNGRKLSLRYELGLGAPVLKTEARMGGTTLRVEAACRFGVLPDFFADDIVLDATRLPAPHAEVASEHFFLHLVGSGEAIVMATWDQRDREIEVTLSGQGSGRRITGSEIAYGKSGRIWLAVLEGKGIWHARELGREDGRKVVALDWQMPFPAAWRADFARAEGLTNSWELIAEQPNGRFRFMKHRPDFFGRSEKEFPPNRRGWSTALGSFHHPCWVDRAGRGFVQVGTHRHFDYVGPVLLYPLDRGRATPLEAYTVVDVVRHSLGVGPCRYILDLEGQQVANKGLFTCGARGTLNGIYRRKQQKQKRAEIEKVLTDVLVFVEAIRGRIDRYVQFGHDLLDFVAEQKQAHPQHAAFLDDMAKLTRQIDARFARRKAAIKTPEYVATLTDEFRRTLLDYEGADAFRKCSRITAAIVRVGDNQDHLVAECRMVIKILRQRAGLALASDPAVEPVAMEIRRRAHRVLRGQLGHEGALYR